MLFNRKIEEAELFFASIFLIIASTAAIGATLEWNVTLNVINPLALTVRWAVPEGRVGPPSTNWDATFYLYVKSADGSILWWTQADLATTTIEGEYATPISITTPMASGTYDVFIKTHQHISAKLNDVALSYGDNSLNFTQPDNSVFLGTRRLLAGDISGAGTATTSLGDDVINSVDLSIMLDSLDDDDLSTRGIRANVNQDPVVNSVDMSLLLDNLDKEGEK